MTRTLAELDTDLNRANANISALRTSLTESFTGLNTKLTTANTDIADLKEKFAQTYKDNRVTQSGISSTFAKISNTLALNTNGLTGLAASLTLLTVGLSIFKVDEKGITILGATREFPWKDKIDKLQEKIESKKQEESRLKKENRDNLIDENETYIKKLKDLDRTYYKASHAGHLSDRINTAKRSADRANREIATLRSQLRTAAASGTPGPATGNARQRAMQVRDSVTALTQALAGI